MTPGQALAALQALTDPVAARKAAAYHKVPRTYLGIKVPMLTALATGWRQGLDMQDRVDLAQALWDSDIHEAKVAAAKLLTQARMRPDDAAWHAIAGWVPGLDAWALADHACDAGARRLVADPARLDTVERWLEHPGLWTRRAALVMTLPWTRQNHPAAGDLAVRERVLGWAVTLSPDRDWFIQKAIAGWLRDLSKHDAPRVAAWLADHGGVLRPFARTEAARLLHSLPPGAGVTETPHAVADGGARTDTGSQAEAGEGTGPGIGAGPAIDPATRPAASAAAGYAHDTRTRP